ncbi:zincin [Sistotremastrum niveocremeum HHB9708]|uniref:Zincin n=1 Tax=Sistotremastrum niveocremeum HHB9708 TaxID=1314777 RepID=A0A164NYB0_9AGAM|nr:zincin [Sistotremastrum niveocremeum HHB9708]
MGNEDEVSSCGFRLPDTPVQVDDSNENTYTTMRLAHGKNWKWPNGSTLRIKFLDGTEEQHRRVKKHAAEWLKYAYLGFSYVTSGDADIRISFDPNGGHNSKLGTNSARNQNEKSMNLAMKSWHTDHDSREYILHEFGHALGCIHEQARPDVPIKWNKDAVYKHYAKPPNKWTTKDVDWNVFKKYDADKIITSSYWDSTSIMQYAVPKGLTTDGWWCPWNTELSSADKAFIASMYPSPTVLNLQTVSRPMSKGNMQRIKATGVHTSNVRAGITGLETVADSSAPRRDKLNFTMANWEEDSKIEVEAYPYQDTYMYNVAVSAIDLVHDVDFQSGQQHVACPSSKKPTKVWVEFEKSYKDAPEVITFINSFQLENEWVMKVWPEGITKDGFWLCSQNYDPSNLHSLDAQWISIPARRGAPRTGTFAGTMLNDFKGHVEFKRRFTKPPLLFVALSQLDADSKHFLRFRIVTTKLTEYGFEWEVNSWWDSINAIVGASYLALEPWS